MNFVLTCSVEKMNTNVCAIMAGSQKKKQMLLITIVWRFGNTS